ncbi:MAG TPA: twin-arginine translocase subunit TatC [Nitrososphaera sp.]|jgi:sec-independent protein translocase protein TatC|nr:twin-arginine translocase subunit TatC [Nitrososphaera sp.]
MAAAMTLREHIEELRVRVFRVAISVIIITIFAMTFAIKGAEFGGATIYYPYPDPIHNLSTQLTLQMQASLLPEEVQLIQTAPGQAFFAQIYVSALIGITASVPIIVRELAAFIAPAISGKVRIGMLNVFVPAVALFVAGIIFSYLAVIPYILDFLYQYGQALNVATFLTISDFISFVLQLLLGFGIAFQLPILMYGVSLTGAVSPEFWRKNFRYAAIILVVFGAIITPDGSGITMWFLAGPMIGLYLAGMMAIERKAARETNL